MTGSEQATAAIDSAGRDNSIVDNSTGEAENTSVDTSSSDVNENNAADDAFLDGFGVSDESDGSKDAADNPKKEDSESDKPEEKTDELDVKSDNPSELPKSGGRPDKRQRQIEKLLADNAQKDAEIAKLRQLEAEQSRAKLPEGDMDGNVTIQEMAEYQKAMTEDVVRSQLASFEQRALAAEDQRNQTEALATVERIVSDARGRHKVLDASDASYNPKVDAFVVDRVKDAIAPFMATNSHDYKAVIDTVEATIAESMKFYDEVGASGAANARKNLDSLRDTSALISKDAGSSASDNDDPFLKGFAS